jgi:signal transduction histidine kinase
VWQNLLDNAWKYSARAPAPKVLVDSWRDSSATWYRVTDNGAGFDMGRADLLFQPFQRMHSSAQFAGTGVGLSLVRRIVELHGGEIRLRSSPGVGTVAEFTLEALGVIDQTSV